MSLHPFNEVNAHLLKRLAGRTECIGRDYSYFKIVQHGMIYAFNGTTKKLLKTYFHLPVLLQLVRYALFSLRHAKSTQKNFKELVILDPGREILDINGQPQSVFFKRIRDHFSSATSTSICLKKEKTTYSDYSLFDFPLVSFSWSKKEIQRIKEVNQTLQNMRDSKHYNAEEMQYIESAFHVFIEQYLRYYSIFKNSGARRVLFIAHYHNEGIIAAARDLGIETLELQHGLINAKDLYYVYDSTFDAVLKNALFPDKIFLYGQYWKEVLEQGAEWSKEQLVILGSSMLGQDEISGNLEFDQKPKQILVASQKGMADLFIPLIYQLLDHVNRHPEWKVIVKLHPYETETERYYNIKNERLEFAPLKSSIKDYLSTSRIQMSIYSTTLFDAAGHEIVNFIWLKEGLGNDYALNLVENKIGIGLSGEEDPIALLETLKGLSTHYLARNKLYAIFNPMILSSEH